jgi:hypothetical protein
MANNTENKKTALENSNANIITRIKPKSPGRVEWGKKLAQMSKANKEAKKTGKPITIKLKEIKDEVEEDVKIDKETNKMLTIQNYQMWIAVLAVCFAAVALYYQRKGINYQITSTNMNNSKPDFHSNKEIMKDSIITKSCCPEML